MTITRRTMIFVAVASCGMLSHAQSPYQESPTSVPGGPATTITACGIAGIPQDCVKRTVVDDSPNVATVVDLQRIEVAQLADVRAKIDALTAAINELKASNKAAADANTAAAQAIQVQNAQFNKDFANALMAKVDNFTAEFVNSPGYKQLKQELVDLINQKLGTPAPANSQPPPPNPAARRRAARGNAPSANK